ncbi:uncharacterized protein LOC135428816 [Drosophila montana]|uniref:uncharacterized protein LOC135428816 n=1 Tax=Drosophila montana TaxID=40370 RepID=UPI00313E1B05
MSKVQEWETYPSIRPAVSHCSGALTAQWLADAVRDSDCGRSFDMEQDDIVEVWKQSPNKDTLGYYGVGSHIHKPEAVVFNQLISECLKKVMPEPTKNKLQKGTTIPPKSDENVKEPSKKDVLNRPLLKSKVDRMPTVQEALDASKALTWLHCPRLLEEKYPFLKGKPHVRPQDAIGIKKFVPKPKHGLRRKYPICKLQCVLPDNACTEYEYRKDPKSYEEFCRKEMERLKAECEEEFSEPRNYPELYPRLVTCFEKRPPIESRMPKKPSSKSEGHRLSNEKTGGKGVGDGGVGDGGVGGGGVGGGGVGGGGVGGGGVGGGGVGGGGVGGEGGGGGGVGGGDVAQHKYTKRDDGKDKDTKPKTATKKTPPAKIHRPKKIFDGLDRPSEKSITTDNEDITPYRQRIKSSTEANRRSKRRWRQKPKKDSNVLETGTAKECACELCHFMKSRERERDSPLIQQLKKEQKRRELLAYYKGMCLREQMKCRSPKYPAPQHKCDAIECDDSFCSNQQFGEYCDCLNAMQHLQNLLDPKS